MKSAGRPTGLAAGNDPASPPCLHGSNAEGCGPARSTQAQSSLMKGRAQPEEMDTDEESLPRRVPPPVGKARLSRDGHRISCIAPNGSPFRRPRSTGSRPLDRRGRRRTKESDRGGGTRRA